MLTAYGCDVRVQANESSPAGVPTGERPFHRRTGDLFWCRSGADCSLELVGPIGLLPGEVVQLTTEVPVGGGLGIDRAQQVEVADDGGRTEVEDLEHGFLDLLVRNRSEEHTSELQSLMRISYAVFCLKK